MRNVGNEPAQITNITADHPYISEIRIANQTIRPNQIVNLSIQVSVPPSPDRRNASIPITFHYREGNTTHMLLVRTGTTTAAAPTGMVAAVPDISTGILKYLFAALALLAGTVTLLRYSSSPV
ncbi:MAG: hypothetical protein SVU32_03820, partial [Candidatus Nanohaloarchaea archaeon]|nr:hypothetical protein [Candidatus Nanohaloarchaea archaeon]